MAQVKRSAASLRISGDDLQPSEITRLLGCDPSAAQAKGETIIGRNTDSARIVSTGMWRLFASKREPEDLDGQIAELLSKLTDDLNERNRSAHWRNHNSFTVNRPNPTPFFRRR